MHATLCKCREFTFGLTLSELDITPNRARRAGKPIQHWQLIHPSSAKVFPDYVPQAIRDDYREACLIRDLSPKASATLSRRCLQGMIRDFWGVKKATLYQEIQALEDKVDPLTWSAIDAVRKVGNIGAHMEQDINLIVDVDPGEAAQLIDLIEMLIRDWYITRHERQERLQAIVKIAQEKDGNRKGRKESKTPRTDASET